MKKTNFHLKLFTIYSNDFAWKMQKIVYIRLLIYDKAHKSDLFTIKKYNYYKILSFTLQYLPKILKVCINYNFNSLIL